MDVFLRSGLWVLSHALPEVSVVGGGPIRVWASDNIAALRRLSRDPLTLHATRFDTLRGLVDLMDDALAAAARMPGPALFQYGGHDALVPKHANAAAWRALPPDALIRRAYYPNDYHLMLRDLGRAAPIGDILAWVADPRRPCPRARTSRRGPGWRCRHDALPPPPVSRYAWRLWTRSSAG